MSAKAMSLKGRIKNYARNNKIALKWSCRITCLNDCWKDYRYRNIVKNSL